MKIMWVLKIFLIITVLVIFSLLLYRFFVSEEPKNFEIKLIEREENDFDNDGVSNWKEIILNTDPVNEKSIPIISNTNEPNELSTLIEKDLRPIILQHSSGKSPEELIKITDSTVFLLKEHINKNPPSFINIEIDENSKKTFFQEFRTSIQILKKFDVLITDIIRDYDSNFEYKIKSEQYKNNCNELLVNLPKKTTSDIYDEYLALSKKISYTCYIVKEIPVTQIEQAIIINFVIEEILPKIDDYEGLNEPISKIFDKE